MKRTLKLALVAVIGAGLMAPAMAQDNFSDVPDNHWAFEALARLKKEGLLVGYPDGLFRGGRPASRYEMAVALHALFLRIKDLTDSLDSQVKAVDGKIAGLPKTGGNTGDLDSLRSTLMGIQSDVNGMKAWGQSVNDLKRLSEEFKRELTGLGVNVKNLQDGLGKLEARVSALEANKPAYKITGDINFLVLGTHGRSGDYGIDKDGYDGSTNGITENASVVHELGLNIASTNEEGPKWWGTIVFGNTLNDGGFNDNDGVGYSEGETDNYIQALGVSFDLGFAAAKVGRLGYKVSPLLFQRVDNTTYYSQSRWDNGEYMVDGAHLAFNFGAVKVDVIGGKTDIQRSNWGEQLTDLNAGPLGIERMLGVTANLPLGDKGSVNLAYLWLDDDEPNDIGTENTPNLINRATVYGGGLTYSLTGNIDLAANYGVSTLGFNDDAKVDSDNTAYNATLTYKGGAMNLFGTYGVVESNYVAPGDWGRLGIERNPTNWKGFTVGGSTNLSSALSLSATGSFLEAKDTDLGGTLGGGNEKADTYTINLGYNLSETLNLMLGYENTKFKDIDEKYTWTTFGLGYKLGANGKLMLTYELADHNLDGDRYRGGLLATQLSIKF